jgi:hypothetical protein
MDEQLAALKRAPWTDEPMFHPPGQHPATARMRAHLAKARELQAKLDTPEVREFITYLEDELAAFEQREGDVKAHYFAMLAEV